jgi:hypothetical protein
VYIKKSNNMKKITAMAVAISALMIINVQANAQVQRNRQMERASVAQNNIGDQQYASNSRPGSRENPYDQYGRDERRYGPANDQERYGRYEENYGRRGYNEEGRYHDRGYYERKSRFRREYKCYGEREYHNYRD